MDSPHQAMISNHLRLRRFLDLVNQQRRHFKTLKSRDDEKNVQDLLKRLKKLPVTAEKKLSPPPVKTVEDPYRCLNFDRLRKLISFYQNDPLTWNPSVLSRIFRLPEYHCENIVFYVRPMVYFATNEYDEVQQLIKTSFVVDVGRFKSDENYLVNYKKIVFPDVR